MNIESKGFCHLKKRLCIKDVKNACRCTLCHQDYSGSSSAACLSLWGSGWERGCSCRCFVSPVVPCPCLWGRNTLLHRSPEVMNNLGKVRGKCSDFAHPR